jgi:hypothetical protein
MSLARMSVQGAQHHEDRNKNVILEVSRRNISVPHRGPGITGRLITCGPVPATLGGREGF